MPSHRLALIFVLAAFALLALLPAAFACGTSAPPPEGLAAELASIVLSAEEVAALYSSSSGAVVVQEVAEFKSNRRMAKKSSSILEYADDFDEIQEAGRVYGYVAGYRLSSATSVYVVIELYGDAEQGQAALERPPWYASRPPLDTAQVVATPPWLGPALCGERTVSDLALASSSFGSTASWRGSKPSALEGRSSVPWKSRTPGTWR